MQGINGRGRPTTIGRGVIHDHRLSIRQCRAAAGPAGPPGGRQGEPHRLACVRPAARAGRTPRPRRGEGRTARFRLVGHGGRREQPAGAHQQLAQGAGAAGRSPPFPGVAIGSLPSSTDVDARIALRPWPYVHRGRPQPDAPTSSRPTCPPSCRRSTDARRTCARCARWSRASRLVTVAGAGGIGKTSLAQAVAHQLRGSYADGVWLADLAPVTTASLVPTSVASALRVVLRGDDQAEAALGQGPGHETDAAPARQLRAPARRRRRARGRVVPGRTGRHRARDQPGAAQGAAGAGLPAGSAGHPAG